MATTFDSGGLTDLQVAERRLAVAQERGQDFAIGPLTAEIERLKRDACPVCNGCDWICDGDHPPKPWADQPGSGPNACGCGAGKPCPECNPLSKERR